MSIYGIFTILSIIILIHIIIFVFRDLKFIRAVEDNQDPEEVNLKELKEIPLLNIIIPAWNEGENFEKCLKSIKLLTYPKLNIIVNAGGSQQTLNIANSYKNNKKYKIIYQKKGGGKIKALNQCLPYVEEGIIYLVDADVYFTDEIILRMIYPIVNYGENVTIGGIRPLPNQKKSDLVKYLSFNYNRRFREKFERYNKKSISGANTCISFKVLKEIKSFTVRKKIAEDLSRGMDVSEKGFKIYQLSDYRARLHSYFPDKLSLFLSQRIRWNQNALFLHFKNRNIRIFKYFLGFILSIYVLISPIFLLYNISWFLLGLFIVFSYYLLKIRRLIFYRLAINKKETYSFKFFLKIVAYIYFEQLINIVTVFEFLFFRKRYKKRKNLS